jgi:hypothetical protein
VLADTGAGTPGKLDYSVPSEPATVHDLLLQKSNGTFELVVWNDRPGGGSNDVTVRFATVATMVKVYDPTKGTSATETHAAAASVALTLTDHPVIVEVSP